MNTNSSEFTHLLDSISASDVHFRPLLESAIEKIIEADELEKPFMRQRLKKASGMNIGDIRAAEKVRTTSFRMTHVEIAEDYIDQNFRTYGDSWKWHPEVTSGLNEGLEIDIGKQYHKQQLCRKSHEYKAIARLVRDIVANERANDSGDII